MAYIRDVDPANHEKVLKIAWEFRELGVEMMLVIDTVEVAHHAFSKGWILEEDIAHIAEEKKGDERKPEPPRL